MAKIAFWVVFGAMMLLFVGFGFVWYVFGRNHPLSFAATLAVMTWSVLFSLALMRRTKNQR